MDKRISRRRIIDGYTDGAIESHLSATFSRIGSKGVEKFYTLWEILSKGIVGPNPAEAYHWDGISKADQSFVETVLGEILPYTNALKKLSPSRRKKIVDKVREAIYGEEIK